MECLNRQLWPLSEETIKSLETAGSTWLETHLKKRNQKEIGQELQQHWLATSPTTFVQSFTIATLAIPRLEKAHLQDRKIETYRNFLESPETPQGQIDQELR